MTAALWFMAGAVTALLTGLWGARCFFGDLPERLRRREPGRTVEDATLIIYGACVYLALHLLWLKLQ